MRFYKNLKDDLHCFQAALKIVLSKYYPRKEYSYTYIDRVTGFKKGQFTQDTKGLLWLAKKGFEIVRVSDFNDRKFVQEGEKYLKHYWKPEIYERNKETTNFVEMRELTKDLLPYTESFVQIPKAEDIDELLAYGYTVIAHINPKVLNRMNADIIHTVVVLESSGGSFYIHNPGLPPEPNKRISRKLLEKAVYELVGIKPKKTKG
jgi:hypothetical protein